MEYKKEEYETNRMFEPDENEINHNQKLIIIRKNHKCCNCGEIIEKKNYAVKESCFLDGKPVSCHTCIPCFDNFLDDIS